jgi:hypothetical protein
MLRGRSTTHDKLKSRIELRTRLAFVSRLAASSSANDGLIHECNLLPQSALKRDDTA